MENEMYFGFLNLRYVQMEVKNFSRVHAAFPKGFETSRLKAGIPYGK